MLGAPDLPPRAAASQASRRPGVGDHVCAAGEYVGLIVDWRPGGLVAVAKRSRSGDVTVEVDGVLVDTLTVSPVTPICANEDLIAARWRRTLG